MKTNLKFPLIALLVVALSMMACSITVDLPGTDRKTGPTQTEQINVPFLADEQATAQVRMDFGAGKLILAPGEEEALISGTATYNFTDFKPELSVVGNEVRLQHGNLDLKGIPTFSDTLINTWDLKLGSAPMELEINAGAYSGTYELGGLLLKRLEINDGASDVHLSFSEPNQTEMSLFEYTTGASSLTLDGLANTNAAEMSFHSGAGSYTLEFSGELVRDMRVEIESGVSSVTIIIPQGIPVVVDTGGSTLLDVSDSGGWDQDGSRYELSGDGPSIMILVEMGAGSLTLLSR